MGSGTRKIAGEPIFGEFYPPMLHNKPLIFSGLFLFVTVVGGTAVRLDLVDGGLSLGLVADIQVDSCLNQF